MRTLALSLPFLFAAACGGGDPTPTGATCPPGSTLTYDNFARPFMEAYCTRCHSSTLQGADRHGAPLYHDFDTEVGILNVRGHVDKEAAAGPDAVNTFMPEGDPKPTDDERYKLGEWLACAAAAPRVDAATPDAAMPDAGPL